MLLATKCCLAQRALVDLLRKVGHLVKLQNVVVAKRLPTDIAAVGLFFGVSPHVDFELLAATESLVADVADVRSLPRVRSPVDDQLPTLDKSLPADLTLVWPLSCVNPHVSV